MCYVRCACPPPPLPSLILAYNYYIVQLETEAIQPLKLKDEENVAIFVVLGVALILAASLTIFALAIR